MDVYILLVEDGWKLLYKVMVSVFIMLIGNLLEELFKDELVWENVKRVLFIEFYFFFVNNLYWEKFIYVVYGLF